VIPLKLFKETKKKRVVAIGELLVELIPDHPEGKLHAPGTIIKTASGSSGIFACAVAKLGCESGFIGQIGKDELSRFVQNVVAMQGVDISKVIVAEEGQIGLSFVEYLENGRNFQFYRKDSVGSQLNEDGIDEQYIKKSAAIHYSGMLLELSDSMRAACNKAVEVAKANDVIVSFDPNIRKELLKKEGAVERLRLAIRKADVISPTLEEAQFITEETEIDKIIEKLHTMGPRVVVITRDEAGAVYSCGGKKVVQEGMKVNAIDPTGAGDTFAAALITGILNGWNLSQIACFTNCAGGLATTKQGTIGLALPTLDEVKGFVELPES
jgi:sugar/nucleoside kinase (ribokinase family)